MPVISVESVVAAESVGSALLTLTMDESFPQDVSVTLRLIGQTADPQFDADFSRFSDAPQVLTVTIPAGSTSLEVPISLNSNADLADENFIIELTDPVNATLSGGVDVLRVSGVITEGARAYFVSDATILEGDSGQKTAVFEIRLSETAGSDLTFNYTTVDGTAQAGSDFVARSGSVTISSGNTTAFVSVPINGDTDVEAWESFSLLVTPTPGTQPFLNQPFADNVGTAIIRDDDAPGILPVLSIEPSTGPESGNLQYFAARISEAFPQDVTFTVRIVGGTADPQTDVDFDSFSAVQQIRTVTIPAGETTVEFFVEHNTDAGDLADESYTLEVTDPVNAVLAGGADVIRVTGVITEGARALFVSDPTILEGDSGTEAIFEVRISEPSDQVLNFSYTTVDGTAQAGSDFTAASGNLTFQPGQTVAYVRVAVTGDTVSEASETFSLRLTPLGDTQTFLNQPSADIVGTAIIRDDDASGILPVLTIEPGSGPESGNLQYFAARISETFAQDVTFTVRIVGGTADPQTDVDFDSFSAVQQIRTVTIPAGETTVEFFVKHNTDAGDLADESYTLEVTDPVNAVLAGGADVIRVTGVITEGQRALFVSDPTILEGDSGTEAIFEVRISEPSDQVLNFSYTTVDGTAQAGSDFTAASGNLTFQPGQTVAYVRVPVAGDDQIEEFETFGLRVAPDAGTEPFLIQPFSDNVGVATIRDDDTNGALPVLSMEPSTGPESSAGQYFALRLSAPFAQDVIVDLTIVPQSADSTDADFDAFSAVQLQQTVTIAAGQTTAEVFIEHNANADTFDENYVIRLDNPVNAVLAGGGDQLRVTGVITGDGRSLFVSDPVIEETDATGREAVFEVRLSTPADVPLAFDYATVNGTAVAGQDFGARSGTLTFLAGETLAYVRVPIIGDENFESDETFSLSVVAQSGSAPFVPGALADNVGVATILNDDLANQAPQGAVVVQGSAIKNETLIADVSGLSDADGLGPLSFQWLRGGAAISGATQSSYVPTGADVGAALSVRVSFTDGGGTPEAVESAPTGTVVAGLVLNGTAVAEVLDGSAGDDRVTGLNGNDVLRGNGGNDTLEGGDGADTLNGGDGDDSILGGATSADLRDVVFAGAGNDNVDGGFGNDDLNGMGGNDTLAGGFGVDTVAGGDGDDVITGSAFSDLVFGNAGNDFVNGGFGSDRVNGGTGADRFFHLGIQDHGSDWIQDYTAADGDVLLFGQAGATADQFQVNAATTNGAGDAGVAEAFVIYRPTGQIMWALVDGMGNGSINLQIAGSAQVFDLLA